MALSNMARLFSLSRTFPLDHFCTHTQKSVHNIFFVSDIAQGIDLVSSSQDLAPVTKLTLAQPCTQAFSVVCAAKKTFFLAGSRSKFKCNLTHHLGIVPSLT